MKGVIFDIQHFSIHDGPGIRSTVFLKGCQIRCVWCHNPEGLSLRPHELSFVPGKCVGCGECVRVCPAHAHSLTQNTHEIARESCLYCGACAKACPTKALSLCGREIEAARVIEEAEKDRAFYRDNGGLTISGGEPMMQRAFVKELVVLAKKAGLNIALETNLCYDFSWLEDLLDDVDIFLADWKETDPQRHRAYTGVTNEQVRQNLFRLHDAGAKVLLRCPIIPGYNDREDHFRMIAKLTRDLPNLLGAEILPYHNLGVSKITRFGLNDDITSVSLKAPSQETVQKWIDFIRSHNGRLINED